jgi:indole-3-glycerol phosphate synthase
MTDILAEIVARKQADLAVWRREFPIDELDRAARETTPARGFAAALRRARADGRFGLIAEIKKASPSHGLIRPAFDPSALARAYRSAGASCLSILTDEPYFSGTPDHLRTGREAVDLPVLRKDFMVDPWQVVESRAMAADCILLIMAALSDGQAIELEAAAQAFGLDVLVEVHDAAELARSLRLETPLIGIKNRNLQTLKTDIATTLELSRMVPADRIVVSESGLQSHADLARMAEAGVTSFLVGESLLRHDDVTAATRALLGTPA